MTRNEMTMLVWRLLREEVSAVRRDLDALKHRPSWAETAGGFKASTLAQAPTANGLSNGADYIDVLWISNGRKPGEGAGAGTGVLAVWQNGAWRRVGDYAAVTT